MTLALDTIRRLLADYDVGEPLATTPLGYGWSNEIHRVETERGPVLLRAAHGRSLDVLAPELELLATLAALDFPVAAPIPRRDGALVTAMPSGPVLLLEWIEGHEPAPGPESAVEIGRALGRLHRVPAPPLLPVGSPTSSAACHALAARLDDAPADWADIVSAFRDETERLAEALALPLPRGVVHGDVFADNTLYSGGRLVALLDFEMACVDAFLLDLGTAAQGFAWIDGEPSAGALKALVAGYEQERALTDAERAVLPAWVRFGAQSMVQWHVEQLLERPHARQLARVRELQSRLAALPDDFGA